MFHFKEIIMRVLKNTKLNFIILILSLLIIFVAEAAKAQEAKTLNVTLTWDANTEPDLSYYKVYWGNMSRIYTANSGNIGKVLTFKKSFPLGQKYFFAVTAVDTEGLESDYSNEVWTDGYVNLKPGAPNIKLNVVVTIEIK
jgi:fibronectin type 3 domain-containing protein